MPPNEPSPFLIDPNGHEHPITSDTATLGRAVECEVVITNKRVSREHARLRKEGRRWLLEDLGSSNGTFLNDERILAPAELRDNDKISIGDVTFLFHDPDTTTVDVPLPSLDVDSAAGVVRVNRKAIALSPKEYSLLTYLYEHRGQVCSKEEIGRIVWSEYQTGGIFDYQIENLVRRLRKRIEFDPDNPQLLATVRGLGYKLQV